MITQRYNRGMKKKIGDLFLLPASDGRVILITKIAARKCNICGKVVKTDELVAHQEAHGNISANYQLIHPPFMSSSMKHNVLNDKQLFPCQMNHTGVKFTAPFTTISSTVNDEAIRSRKSSDNQIARGRVKKRSHTPSTPLVPLSPNLKLSNSNQIFKIKTLSELNNAVNVPVTIVSSSSGGKVGSGSQGTDKQKTPENIKQFPSLGPLFGDWRDSTEIQEIDHKKGKEGPDPCVSSPSGNSVDQYKCSACAEVFSSKKWLQAHVKTHSSFKCDLCNRSFKQSFALISHKRYHSAVKNYKCNVCNYSCTYKAHLMSHQKKHLNQYNLQCDTCNNGFHSQQELEEHCNSQHSGKKPYIYDKRSNQFPSRKNLMNHKRTLLEEELQKCKVCNKRFIFKNSLLRHMRTHSKESSFLCEQCGKSFSSNSSLKYHRLAHTEEKPHHCKVCDKRFLRRTSLVIHEQIHTGQRPKARLKSHHKNQDAVVL